MPYRDPEMRRLCRQRYYQEHREESREQRLIWIENNRERFLETTRARSQTYYHKHREKLLLGLKRSERLKRDHLRRTYGLTLEELRQRIADQDDQCAVCRQPIDETTVRVDHDHGDNHIRGLLCNGCNSGIGMFRDRPEFCEAAAAYLRQS